MTIIPLHSSEPLEQFKAEAEAAERSRAAAKAELRAREAEHRQQHAQPQTVDGPAWDAWCDARIQQELHPLLDAIGEVIAELRQAMRKDVAEAVSELREFEAKVAAAEERLGTISEKLRIAGWVDSEFVAKALKELRQAFERALEENERLFGARLADLEVRLKCVPGTLPRVKVWHPESVTYTGEVVSYNGSAFQALQDTATRPGGEEWAMVACGGSNGRDGRDGTSLNLRGAYNARKHYERLDVIEFGGDAFVARHSGPGLCPGGDWLPLSVRGSKGDKGAPGPRGANGDPGPSAPSIHSWTVDAASYRVVFFTTDGKPGPELNLRPLFKAYYNEVSG